MSREIIDAISNDSRVQALIVQCLLPKVIAEVMKDHKHGKLVMMEALEDGNIQEKIYELMTERSASDKVRSSTCKLYATSQMSEN